MWTAGSVGRNFPSTIYAQSSIWGPAAAAPAQPGPTVNRAAKAGALFRQKPNPLSRRAARYYAAVSAVDFLTGKAAEADDIIRSGWPLPDPDTSMPLDDRKRARPTRAILIGWLQGSRPTSGSRRPGSLITGPFQSHKPVLRSGLPSAFVHRALKLARAQRKAGRFETMLLGSVRFVMTPPHKCGRLLGTATGACCATIRTLAGLLTQRLHPSRFVAGTSIRHSAGAKKRQSPAVKLMDSAVRTRIGEETICRLKS